MNRIKNDTLVLYPEDSVDLYQHCSSQQLLYSVINHNSSLNDGDYTTFSRDISLNQQSWVDFDNEINKYLQTDKLSFNFKAYLLFYIRKKTSEEPMNM